MTPGTGTPSGPRSRRRRWFRVAAVGAGLLAAFVLLEAGLRIRDAVRGTYELSDDAKKARNASPWTQSADPELVYVHRPGLRAEGELKIEAHGILRPADAGPRREGVPRIAVLGDSVGAALYSPYAETIPALLESLLAQDAGKAHEVLNFCVTGYDTLREARLLETAVAPLEPDAVVVLYCLNDPGESVVPVGWFRDPDPPASRAIPFLAELFGIGVRRERVIEADASGGADVWRRMYEPDGPGWAVVQSGFDRIAAWAEPRRVPVLVAILPLLTPADPGGKATAGFRAQVAAAARERRMRVVDLQDAIAERSIESMRAPPMPGATAEDVYHFNGYGHSVLAAALAPEVRKMLR